MTEKKGGARASKFLKTVNRASRISQQSPEIEEIEEVGEEQEPAATEPQEDETQDAVTVAPPAAESADTHAAQPSGETKEQAREQEQQGRRQAGRRSSGTRRTRAKKRERPAKPVRITVDLNAERHQFLRDYAFREDAKGTAIIRALLDELQEDPDLSGRVNERLLDQDPA